VRNREVAFLALILLVAGLALWIDFAPAGSDGRQTWLNRDVSTRLGLDLQGGTQVLLKAQNPNVTADQIATAAGVIERRVNGLGVSEAVVQRSGNDRIIVELPGVKDPNQAINTIRSAGRLEFIDSNGQYLQEGTVVRTEGNPNPAALQATATPVTGTTTLTNTGTTSSTGALSSTTALSGTAQTPPSGPVYQSITDGKDLNTGSVQPRFSSNQPGVNPFAVTFAFEGESAQKLAQFSAQNVGKPMCIALDNRIVSCPTIQSALANGQGEITVSSRAAVEQLYNQLKYGALPVSFNVESSRTVTATLGQSSVNASLLAGVVGLVVVGLFMLLYYRLPGLLATIALVIYTAITFALYKLIPITLTLAGIAGFILSIGLAVDANVLIFARLKEELRRGRTLRAAIEMGFSEAWPAIRDSSVSTLITSIILFLFGNSYGVSLVKGFALTLGLGILISLFTAITVTRTLLRVIGPLQFAQNPWMYELESAPALEHEQQQSTTAA
jgi:preprotein translocase subunit SecD